VVAVAHRTGCLRCPSERGFGMLYAAYTRVRLVYEAGVEVGVSPHSLITTTDFSH